jgi:Adenylate and Guanylate cyclase catalytic domain
VFAAGEDGHRGLDELAPVQAGRSLAPAANLSPSIEKAPEPVRDPPRFARATCLASFGRTAGSLPADGEAAGFGGVWVAGTIEARNDPRFGAVYLNQRRRYLGVVGPRAGESYTRSMGETRRIVTIVFADVSGSTRLGEELDAEALRRVMERYFEEMRGILERHGTAGRRSPRGGAGAPRPVHGALVRAHTCG